MSEEKNYRKTLTVVSILFILFGVVFAALSALGLLGAAYNLYVAGFWGGFITAFITIFDVTYSVLVVIGGICGLRRKRLDFCYKLGVLLTVFSILRIMMSLTKVIMGGPHNYLFYLSSILSVLLPFLYVLGVSHAQKGQPASSPEMESQTREENGKI
jgi:hypothetical protein